MSCQNGIAKAITADCTTQPTGGLEVLVYAFNRGQFTMTYDGTDKNMITDIERVSSSLMYKIKGVRKNINAGHERIIDDNVGDSFSHFFNFLGFSFENDDVSNLDGMNDISVIVEYKNKTTSGEGIYVGYGIKSGLYVSSDKRDSNDTNGVRKMELKTRDQEGEPYSQYNVLAGTYAATKALLESLTAPAV